MFKPDARRQRLEKTPSVSLADDARIQNDHPARISMRSNQASDSLLEADDRPGELILREGPPSPGLDLFMTCLDQRTIRHIEGKSGHDDVSQRSPADIDPLPETRRAEENASIILTKPAYEQSAGTRPAMHVQWIVQVGETWSDSFDDRIEVGETCEQHERAAVGLEDMIENAICEFRQVVLCPGFRHRALDDDSHLLGVIERTAELKGLGILAPESRLHVGEIIR